MEWVEFFFLPWLHLKKTSKIVVNDSWNLKNHWKTSENIGKRWLNQFFLPKSNITELLAILSLFWAKYCQHSTFAPTIALVINSRKKLFLLIACKKTSEIVISNYFSCWKRIFLKCLTTIANELNVEKNCFWLFHPLLRSSVNYQIVTYCSIVQQNSQKQPYISAIDLSKSTQFPSGYCRVE